MGALTEMVVKFAKRVNERKGYKRGYEEGLREGQQKAGSVRETPASYRVDRGRREK